MEKVKVNQIESVITELFRKNNSEFIRSKLSDVMLLLFKALNGVSDENVRYMKSSIIPHRIYYIYSEKVPEDKIYDLVTLNDEPCIWIYSINAINKIGNDTVEGLNELITVLMKMFRGDCVKYDTLEEHKFLNTVITIRILKFLKENYNIDKLSDNMDDIKELLDGKIPDESKNDIILEIYNDYEYDNSNYYYQRSYLETLLRATMKDY